MNGNSEKEKSFLMNEPKVITNSAVFDLYLSIYKDFELKVKNAESFINEIKSNKYKMNSFKRKFDNLLDEIKNNYFILFNKKYTPKMYKVDDLIVNLSKDLKNRLRYELYILIYMLDAYFNKERFDNMGIYDIYLLGIYLMEYETLLHYKVERAFRNKNLSFNFNNRTLRRTSINNFENLSTLFHLRGFNFVLFGKTHNLSDVEDFMNSIGLTFTMPLIQVYLLRKYIEVAIIRDALNIESFINNRGREVPLLSSKIYSVLEDVIKKKMNTLNNSQRYKLENDLKLLKFLMGIHGWCNIYIHGPRFPKIWVLDYIIFKLIERLKPNHIDNILHLSSDIISECYKEIEEKYNVKVVTWE